jgi:alginate O-acetyltransferase complex protein AlgI
VVLLLAIVGATPLVKQTVLKISNRNTNSQKAVNIAEPVLLVLLMLVMTAYLVDGSFNPFLYFRF